MKSAFLLSWDTRNPSNATAIPGRDPLNKTIASSPFCSTGHESAQDRTMAHGKLPPYPKAAGAGPAEFFAAIPNPSSPIFVSRRALPFAACRATVCVSRLS